jgi:hypothetical protein
VQDAGELGVVGLTVILFDCDGKQLGLTTTDNAGNYGFTDLTPGCYVVQFVPPSNMQLTKTGAGQADTDSNADIFTGRTAQITLVGGQIDPTVDAGMFLNTSVKVVTTPTTTAPATATGAVTARDLPRTGSSTYRSVVAAGLLAEIGALFLFIDSRRKKLI